MTIQRLRVRVPPTLSELLDDPLYARYFSRNPIVPGPPTAAPIWRLMARRPHDYDGAEWALRDYSTYADARRAALRLAGSLSFRDVSVVSRRSLYKPPLNFTWPYRFSWCGRCRRPTLFKEMHGHPALRGAPVVDRDSISRCYYCGVRESMMPAYVPRLSKGVGG